MSNPGRLHRRAAGEQHYHVVVDGGHGLQQLDLVVPQGQGLTVEPLGLRPLVQAQIGQNHIRRPGQRRGLGQQAGILPAVAEEAGGVPRHLQAALPETVQRAVHPGGIDTAGTAPLKPRPVREVPDHGHPGAGGQGEQAALVFQ